MKIKQASLKVHYTLSIVVVFFVVLQAITGMAISWRWDLAQIASPSAMISTPTATPIDLDELFRTAGEQLPPTSATRIFFPHDDDGVYLFQLSTESGIRYASVDTANGRVLKFGDRWRFPVEAALHLHTQLLSGKLGYTLVLVTGLLLTLMAVTGIVFWWPRSGSWRSRLTVNFRHPFKAVVRSLHRTTGICLAPLLILMAVTGIVLAGELLVTATPAMQRAAVHYEPIREQRIGDIVDKAMAQFPQSRVRDVRLVEDGTATVQLWQPGTDRWYLHRVVFDADSSQVIDVISAADNKALWMTFLPFHTGSILGFGGRIVITATGFGLLLLATLGLVLWLTKRGRSRKQPAVAAASLPAGRRPGMRAGTPK
ncbi:MAG: PepSY-associated TM helix domain-containing protein [Gammaproteobacteria bacterium]|nr:PepSY-associated TM helix domain-containing protein [Gammaproteobacteria bacterium]